MLYERFPPHGLCHTVTANSIHVCFHHLVFFIMLHYFNTLMNYLRWRRFWHIIQFTGDRHTCSDTSNLFALNCVSFGQHFSVTQTRGAAWIKSFFFVFILTLNTEDRKGKGRISSTFHATFHICMETCTGFVVWTWSSDLMGIMLPLHQSFRFCSTFAFQTLFLNKECCSCCLQYS